MSYPTEETQKRILELILISLERDLSPDELRELENCFANRNGSSPEELAKEVLDPTWLKENYRIMENIERSKDEAWKKIWDAINEKGDK